MSVADGGVCALQRAVVPNAPPRADISIRSRRQREELGDGEPETNLYIGENASLLEDGAKAVCSPVVDGYSMRLVWDVLQSLERWQGLRDPGSTFKQ